MGRDAGLEGVQPVLVKSTVSHTMTAVHTVIVQMGGSRRWREI